MHAPRRSHALPRPPAAWEGIEVGGPSPLSNTASDESPLPPDEEHCNPRKRNGDATPPLSPLARPGLLPSSMGRSTDVTAIARKQRTDHLSPRAMWRAPTPRPVPLPDLLPGVSTSSAVRASRPVGGSHKTLAGSPAIARSASSSTGNGAVAEAESSDRYGQEYVRLVFDSPRSTSVSVSNSLSPFPPIHRESPNSQQDTPVHDARRLPPVSPSTNVITDAQATAMLAGLPDQLVFARENDVPRTLHAATAAFSKTTQHCSPGASAQTDMPQSETWWSTLDGTLAAYNSLTQQNLNTTLGRADRAAMVLSINHPQHSVEDMKRTADDALTHEPERHTSDGTSEANGAVDSVSAAVAALAARLSRAAEKSGNNSNNNSNGGLLADLTAGSLTHQNTIQELRETLRLTDVLLHDAPLPPPLEAAGPSANAVDEKDLVVEAVPSLDACNRLAQVESDEHSFPVSSVVQQRQQQRQEFYSQHDSRAGEAEWATGLDGAGTKRTRDALARLYAMPNTNTSLFPARATTIAAAAATTATSTSPPPQRTPSYLHRSGSSFMTPVPAVSTDGAISAMPWQCGQLTAAALEQRYGPPAAFHASNPRHVPSKSHAQLPLQGNGRRRSPAGRGTGVEASRHARKRQLQSPPSSPASSVATDVFSCASLSSSIFLHELGNGEALWRSYMTGMSNSSSSTAVVQGDAGASRTTTATRTSNLVSPPQTPHPQNARGAAAQYRREQQRLYASHLTEASRRLAGETSNDVLEPYLDVDYLFSDVKRITQDDTIDGLKKSPEKSSGLTDASGAAAPPSNLPAGGDALKAALQARQALLHRHVQSSPAWERLLYKVRQWCDRTQVMVRLENGECVEQMGAHPPPRTSPTTSSPAQQEGQQQQVQQRASTSGNAATAAAASTTAAEHPYYTYVDDPAVEHDRVMEQLAQEEEDIQRRNALLRCRQRQHQWEAVLSESTLPSVDGGDAAAGGDNSSNVAHMDRFASSGLPSTWTRSSFRSVADIALPDAKVTENAAQLPFEIVGTPSMTMPPQQSSHEAARGKESTTTDSSSTAAAAGPQAMRAVQSALQPPVLGATSTSPYRAPSVVPDPASRHAALCSKLQTWGEPLEESEGDGTDAVFAEPAELHGKSVEWRGQDGAGTLVLWKRDSARVSVDAGEEANRRAPVDSVNAQDAPSSRLHSRTTSLRQSSVEQDLLAFVLTCGSSSSAAGDDLRALLASAEPFPTAAQRATAAVEAMLRDGLGVAGLPLEHATAASMNGNDMPRQRQAPDGEAERAASRPPSPLLPPLPWEAWVTALLEGYNALDLMFLKRLHGQLWGYDAWRRNEELQRPTTAESARRQRRRSPNVTIQPSAAPALSLDHSPPVYPLRLFTTTLSAASTRFAARKSSEAEESALSAASPSSVSVDVADLFGALVTAPGLIQWLQEAQKSSPTSSWMDVVQSMPVTQRQAWHAALTACVDEAARQTSTPPPPAMQSSHPSPPAARRDAQTSAKPNTSPSSVCAFMCDVPVAVSAVLWRQQLFHDLLQLALAYTDKAAPPNVDNRSGSSNNNSNGSSSRQSASRRPSRAGLPTAPSLSCLSASSNMPFPCIGSTPYIPDEEGRTNYPLDMPNAYLFSSLAREDVANRLVPQLRETRRQFADALHSARASVAATADATPASPLPKASTSLPLALQQRVHVHRLAQCEQRFLSLLSSLWSQEQMIRSFNQHVADFNKFTRAAQRLWGPLYRSSLMVAYCVCEELAEKKMENLSVDLLPFVSVVAAFMGCRGGHRELRAKLPSVMLDLVERAKKVQVHLDSVAWQGKRAQVLSEAVAAAQAAPRGAGAVVSCLATESDVTGVPLTEVALPDMLLKDAPALAPPEG